MPNPVEAYRKLQKKREKEKLRKNRQEVRETAKLLQEPEKLKKELDELSHKSIIGRVDEADSLRKEKLEKLWEKHAANLVVSTAQAVECDDLKNKSESDSDSSSDDDSDSDDERPKCIIEIVGKTISHTRPLKRKIKEEKLGDDFALELLSNAPPISAKMQQEAMQPPGHLYPTPLQKARIAIPKPNPPLLHTSMQQVPPPPPPPPPPRPQENKIAITLPKKETSEVKVVPLASYFVPNQLRINRGNK